MRQYLGRYTNKWRLNGVFLNLMVSFDAIILVFSRITWSVTVIRQELLVYMLEFLGGDSEYLVSTSWKRFQKGFRCPMEWVSKGYKKWHTGGLTGWVSKYKNLINVNIKRLANEHKNLC